MFICGDGFGHRVDTCESSWRSIERNFGRWKINFKYFSINIDKRRSLIWIINHFTNLEEFYFSTFQSIEVARASTEDSSNTHFEALAHFVWLASICIAARFAVAAIAAAAAAVDWLGSAMSIASVGCRSASASSGWSAAAAAAGSTSLRCSIDLLSCPQSQHIRDGARDCWRHRDDVDRWRLSCPRCSDAECAPSRRLHVDTLGCRELAGTQCNPGLCSLIHCRSWWCECRASASRCCCCWRSHCWRFHYPNYSSRLRHARNIAPSASCWPMSCVCHTRSQSDCKDADESLPPNTSDWSCSMPTEWHCWQSRENYLVMLERHKPPPTQRSESASGATVCDDDGGGELELKSTDNRLSRCQDFEIHWCATYDDFHTC